MADLDYKASLENALAMIKKQVDLEEEYFSSMIRIQELNPYTTAATKNLFNIKMADQMLLFKALIQLGEVAKYLCEKYELNVGEDETEDG